MKKDHALSRGLFCWRASSVVLVPAAVTTIVVVVVTVMATSFIACRSVLALILGGDGHACRTAYRAADDGTIAATYCITDCCTSCTAYCTAKNRIRCRASLGCASRQRDGNNRNPLVHLHDLLLSLSKWRQSSKGGVKRTSSEMLASIEKRLPDNVHGIYVCLIPANYMFLMCFIYRFVVVVL